MLDTLGCFCGWMRGTVIWKMSLLPNFFFFTFLPPFIRCQLQWRNYTCVSIPTQKSFRSYHVSSAQWLRSICIQCGAYLPTLVKWVREPTTLLFSLFIMTHLIAQESVMLLSFFFKTLAYFDVKCHIVYTMKTRVWNNILYWRNVLTTSHNMELKLI